MLDGNHLAASEKRRKPLRGFRGAALPGQSLVVYAPELDLVVDMRPAEDAHAQERALMGPLREVGRAVRIEDETGRQWMLRRVVLHLDEPTEDGETVIRLLTNVPAERMGAQEVARLYRRRWSIEGMFGRLEAVFQR